MLLNYIKKTFLLCILFLSTPILQKNLFASQPAVIPVEHNINTTNHSQFFKQMGEDCWLATEKITSQNARFWERFALRESFFARELSYIECAKLAANECDIKELPNSKLSNIRDIPPNFHLKKLSTDFHLFMEKYHSGGGIVDAFWLDRGSKRKLRDWGESDVWVCYACYSNTSIHKKFTETGEINTESLDDIEMAMMLLTHPDLPFTVHLGIFRTASSQLQKLPHHKNLSIFLHAFAAKTAQTVFEGKKLYMATDPIDIMKEILIKKFGNKIQCNALEISSLINRLKNEKGEVVWEMQDAKCTKYACLSVLLGRSFAAICVRLETLAAALPDNIPPGEVPQPSTNPAYLELFRHSHQT
ncbi:MAG: hypothetical protein H6850_02355 [Alphaproteobacteria bacterium]|nr:MAG: hypothetical protein H6850_02355 [Alphaproteobacteria bacterium]